MRLFRKRYLSKTLQYLVIFLATYYTYKWIAVRLQLEKNKITVHFWPLGGPTEETWLLSTSGISASNSETANLAYREKWVGFPDLDQVNCAAALSKSVKNSRFNHSVSRIAATRYSADSADCASFRRHYGFDRYPKASQEELDFPIAFIILFDKNLDQVAFLLRAIYRSHNVYCLNVDKKANQDLLQGARALDRCLPNVFLASRLERIVYAGFSRLQADVNCMADLIKHKTQWRYVINMPGQEFPLRTNLEMVRILQQFNGMNDVEGITGNRMIASRFRYKYVYITNNATGELVIRKTSEELGDPPHGFVVVKGSAYGTFSRAFVVFVLQDKRAQDLLRWCEHVRSPDEYYWATLHHSNTVPVPGGYTVGAPDKKAWLTTYASWGNVDPCATIRKRAVCIFSPEDLPHLLSRKEFFANKFYITHFPVALHCLDQMLYNLTVNQQTRDLSFYKGFPNI